MFRSGRYWWSHLDQKRCRALLYLAKLISQVSQILERVWTATAGNNLRELEDLAERPRDCLERLEKQKSWPCKVEAAIGVEVSIYSWKIITTC